MPEPIQIVIKRTYVSQEAQTAQQAQAENEPGKPKAKDGAICSMLINYGKNAMQTSVNLFTKLSGNQSLSRAFEDLTTVAGDVATIAAGGWVGVASVAVSKTSKIINAIADQKIADARLKFIQDQMGNSAMDGSRGWMR